MLVVDTDALVAFEHTVKLSVRLQNSIAMCCCGGEGLFNTTVTGPGLVIVQSMSFGKFKSAVAPAQNAPPSDNSGPGNQN